MTPAQRDRLRGFAASLKARGVQLILKPSDAECLALIEVVDEQSRKRLQIGDDPVTHAVHIERTALTVPLDSIAEIQRTDSSQTYRVQHFRDDAQRPTVIFFAILS